MVLKTEMEDNNRDFNALNYLRSYDPSELIAIWNVEKHAKITKLDLPTIFHNEVGSDGGFKQYDLPSKWFGNPAVSNYTLPDGKETPSLHKVLISGWYDVVSNDTITLVNKPNENTVFLWAGDDVPYTGQVIQDYVRGISVTVTSTIMPPQYHYIVDDSIAFVLVHTSALPFMSGFEVGTEFWNGRALTSTNFLIFGHNNLEFLEEYPRIKVRVTQED